MHKVLDKDMIENEIVPYIPRASRGFPPTVPLCEIVIAILYKLKTGVQWNQLPVKALFEEVPLSWQSVYRHYRKWCRAGFWKECWTKLVSSGEIHTLVIYKLSTSNRRLRL